MSLLTARGAIKSPGDKEPNGKVLVRCITHEGIRRQRKNGNINKSAAYDEERPLAWAICVFQNQKPSFSTSNNTLTCPSHLMMLCFPKPFSQDLCTVRGHNSLRLCRCTPTQVYTFYQKMKFCLTLNAFFLTKTIGRPFFCRSLSLPFECLSNALSTCKHIFWAPVLKQNPPLTDSILR